MHTSNQPIQLQVHRRTRNDPRRRVQMLLQQRKPRLPTSLAEAQAAAHVDAELRRAGMSVSVDTFRTASGYGALIPMLWIVGLLALLSWFVAPWFGIALAAWCLLTSICTLAMPKRPLFARQGDSQNVVATRPAEKEPHWRVVLLTRVDVAKGRGTWQRLIAPRGLGAWVRLLASALLTGLLVWAHLSGQAIYTLLASLPLLYFTALTAILYLPFRPSASSVGTGALAAQIAAAEQAANLHAIELWAVALGATAQGQRDGLRNFLERYPFPRGDTLFIGIDQLDVGKLSIITREQIVRVQYADPYLLKLLAEVDASDPSIDAEPRVMRDGPSLIAPLLRQGYRAVLLRSYGQGSIAPAQSGDPLDALDERLIAQAARLIVGLVHKLDS
jgi:hypothetical protein